MHNKTNIYWGHYKALKTWRFKIFSIFLKTFSRIIWTVLTFLSYNEHYWANMFSVPWQIIILLSKFGSAFNIYLSCFQSHKISLRVSLKWSFGFFPMSLSLGHYHRLCQNRVSHLCYISFPWLPCTTYPDSLKWQQGRWSHGHLFFFFNNFIYVGFEFHFQWYHLSVLCCIFNFAGRFPLLIICFYKMLRGFITGRQRDNTTISSAVCVWTE